MSALYSDKRGFTILELLVACAVLVILMSLVIAFLVPGMRISALGAARVEIQQEALRSIQKINTDLDLSVPAGVGLYITGAVPKQGPLYLSVMRLSYVDPQGKQLWEDNLVVYSWKGPGTPLVRKVWTPSSQPALGLTFTTPSRFLQSQIIQIADEPLLRGQIVARDVAELNMESSSAAPTVSSPVKITIKLSREAATGRKDPEVFELSRTIGLRNQTP
ncbi:MAG: type II secretion system protein [Candidatus Eremiobacteraeota bacterium]|nr:type II secretion system protein [Candidatus Eremiobacteraeota bacterium]